MQTPVTESDCLEVGRCKWEELPKEHKETLGGDEYIYYLDFDDGFMSVHTYAKMKMKFYTLNIYTYS